MNELEKQYKKSQEQLKLFEQLQKGRNIDFPKNLKNFYLINYKIFKDYYCNVVCNIKYDLKTDYTLRVLIYNYIASVKSYINRKRRKIEKIIPSIYLKDVTLIILKYNKAHRKETKIDKLVAIRDVFEHDEIDNISLTKTFYSDHVDYCLKYDNLDLSILFEECNNEIEKMNDEIEKYVQSELDKLNLRYNCLFMNAFYRKFKNETYTNLFPEETKDEKEYFDELINKLQN